MFIAAATRASEQVIRSNLKLLSRIAAERKRFEDWLQLEMLKLLMVEYPRVEIERAFPGTQERCDFWLAEPDGAESWLELKLCVTNYCSQYCNSAGARPITNQVSEIERDLSKLERLPTAYDRAVLLIAYPLPDAAGIHPKWETHLARLKAATGRQPSEVFDVRLQHNDKTAKTVAYLLRLGRTEA